MAGKLTSAQADFLRLHLGIDVVASAGETASEEDAPRDPSTRSPDNFVAAWATARDQWDKAEEAVGHQISEMQSAFRKSGARQLVEVANFGLPALTGNTRTKALAAIIEVERVKANPNASILSRADKSFADLLAQLGKDPRISACDRNPFGLRVSIVQTLSPALDGLRKVLHQGMAD